MIANYWPTEFRAIYGVAWPRNYCAFDLETTGYEFKKDVITEWGHCLVQDGKPTDRLSIIIDWTGHPIVADHWLRWRLEALRKSMEVQGRKCHITYDRMKREGMKPDKALSFIYNFLRVLTQKNSLFVAHNGYSFDEKMLSHAFTGFGVCKEPFSFGDNSLIDTDGVEKASQCLTNPRVHVRAGDTLRSYFHRVRYTRVNGVRSNLDDHCFDKYEFAKKYGIDRKTMHGAYVDSYCCHLLMQEFGKLVAGDEVYDSGMTPVIPRAQPKTKPYVKTVHSVSPSGSPRRRGQRNN